MLPKVPVEDRARNYVAKMPPAISGAGGHDATFAVACVLVRGFGLTPEQALPIFRDWNSACQPPWSEHDLAYKLQSADRSGSRARGWLLDAKEWVPSRQWSEGVGAKVERAKPATFDEAALAKLAADVEPVNALWLADRSAHDPVTLTSADFLASLYEPGERIIAFRDHRSQGQALWPDEKLPESGHDGVWFLPQPVDGEYHPNPRTGSQSRRSEESVKAFRYLVLESDEAPAGLWLRLLVQLPARIEAIYTSGGRSVHALVRLNCRTKSEWDQERQTMRAGLGMLFLAGLDRGVLSAVRLSRLPGCYRISKKATQRLLYVQPKAGLRPIRDLPRVRDTERVWCAAAALGISDADETGGDAMKAALFYYGRWSAACREALDTLKDRAE